jgi:hypothetical protein
MSKKIRREPTQEMMDAGLYHSSADASYGDVWTIWQAMWDAANDPTAKPTPAQQPGLAFEDILTLVKEARATQLHPEGLAARISNHIAAHQPPKPQST